MRTLWTLPLVLFLGCVEPSTDDAIANLRDVATSTADELGGERAVGVLHLGDPIAECPGMTQVGIEDYDGIVGYYTRFFPYVSDELITLRIRTVAHDPEWIGVSGEYTATVQRDGLYAVEGGTFLAVPNNPAIGPAIAFDIDDDGAVDELYWVLGATRNVFGNIDKLCVGKSRSDGSGSPFLLYRLGL